MGKGATSNSASKVYSSILTIYKYAKKKYTIVFLRKVIRQNDTNVMSHSMQLEKVGHGLLGEAYWGERECFVW